MAGDLGSGQTTSLSNLSIGGKDAQARGFGALSVASFILMPGGPTISKSSVVLNQARLISMRTLGPSAVTASAGATNVATDELVMVIGGASGATLVINSGGTLYHFASTASSALA